MTKARYRPGLATAKLSDEEIAKLRALWAAGGVTQTALAARFKISRSYANHVLTGRARPAKEA